MNQNTGTNRKRGNKAGIWFFENTYKIFGLNTCYLFLYLVVPYYLLFDRKAVQSVMPYVEKRFPKSGFFSTYKHIFLIFLNQGKQLINRYAFLRNEELFNVSSNGLNKLLSQSSNTEKGFIILTSHTGNWQLAIKRLRDFKKTVNIVMRLEENRAVKEALQLYPGKDNIKIITPSEENLGGVFEIVSALNHGEIVAISGDKNYGADIVAVEFLGGTAFFPYSAFKIAAGINCQVAVLLTYQKKETEYILDVSNLLYPKYSEKKNKKEQLRLYVQEYADIVAAFVKKYPYSYFVFYDVWKKDN